MKKTDALVKLIESEINDKDVLEVACGGAEFQPRHLAWHVAFIALIWMQVGSVI